ncbi:YheU family protein [Tolumonas lignilytica]|uniref:YheU family protein n=1 Tax=Tolumonas lignilytica TaxID=1283284 RepID=UPI00046529D3|nr:YheU family protein [Tolumonas lignilytica]
MIIPWQQLPNATLDNLIESFVLREGTDYGEQTFSLSEKVTQVRQQLERGDVVILYSELHESVTIVPKNTIPPIDDVTEN